MEHIALMQKRVGEDVFYGNKFHLYPANGDGRVGAEGLNKNLSLSEIIEIAYRMEERPNIIIKAGPNAKWYLKYCQKELIAEEVEKQRKWRDISRSTMWIIDWNDK